MSVIGIGRTIDLKVSGGLPVHIPDGWMYSFKRDSEDNPILLDSCNNPRFYNKQTGTYQ